MEMKLIDLNHLKFIGNNLKRPECVLVDKEETLHVADWRGGVEISGLRGPFNRYRAQNIDWNELAELDKKLKQPACFITGTLDPVNFFIATDEPLIDRIEANYENLLFAEELEGIGHWTQQEAPEEVNRLILKFLKQVS
jgi:pimeloyl-ACP methyl ester carboxylesterase